MSVKQLRKKTSYPFSSKTENDDKSLDTSNALKKLTLFQSHVVVIFQERARIHGGRCVYVAATLFFLTRSHTRSHMNYTCCKYSI